MAVFGIIAFLIHFQVVACASFLSLVYIFLFGYDFISSGSITDCNQNSVKFVVTLLLQSGDPWRSLSHTVQSKHVFIRSDEETQNYFSLILENWNCLLCKRPVVAGDSPSFATSSERVASETGLGHAHERWELYLSEVVSDNTQDLVAGLVSASCHRVVLTHLVKSSGPSEGTSSNFSSQCALRASFFSSATQSFFFFFFSIPNKSKSWAHEPVT